jgi:retron-type reverse transcriptase
MIADWVVHAVLKLVLEPIFETDFEPVSYGFPAQAARQDAIAEIHHFGTQAHPEQTAEQILESSWSHSDDFSRELTARERSW